MMKRWMAVLGIVFLCSPVVRAEEPVYFADANLKADVETELGTTDPTPTDMLRLQFLDSSGRGITNLTGLEYATNLCYVVLSFNEISDISPLAGSTPRLDLVLDLSFNQISDISPLAGLTDTREVYLQGNQISDISSLVGLTNLFCLRLQGNPLNQEACSVYIPQIRNNNPGAFIYYDPCVENPVYFADANLKADVEAVLGKTNPTPTDMLGLTSLWAQARGITDLTGLEYATNLTALDLSMNEISDLSPLAGLTNLTDLDLGDNHQIGDLAPLAGLTNLTDLGLAYNQISDLSPLAGLTNLMNLGLASNQISDVSPLGGLTNLRVLGLAYNQISDISSLVGLTSLSQLFLQGNPLNREACDVYIPQIIENNPGVDISYDPCIEAAVPNVVGMTQTEAEAALIAAGFIVGEIWWGPSDLPEGTVFAQDPAGGAMAAPGSAVGPDLFAGR